MAPRTCWLVRWSSMVALWASCKDVAPPAPSPEPVTPPIETSPPWWWADEDQDGDGWAPRDGDCVDSDPAVHPGAADPADDGVDQDCDGSDRCARRPELVWTHADPPFQVSGYALAVGGDLDRDGQIELTVGSPGIFGNPYGADAFGNVYQLEGLTEAYVAHWNGSEAGDRPLANLGIAVAAGGDTDGDGFGEVLAASRMTSDEHQGVYLIRDPDPLADAVVFEETWFRRIREVHFADVDRDGVEEVLVLSGTEGPAGEDHYFQLRPPATGTFALGDEDYLEFLDDTVPLDYLAPGDFDGDGRADLLVSRASGSDRVGTVYGCASPSWSGIADGDQLCTDRWEGEHLDSHAGMGLASGGDLDGDGQQDALVGSVFYSSDAFQVGRAYVLTDPLGGGTRSLGESHAQLTGEVAVDRVGQGLHGPGDLDGDGHDDVLFGAASFSYAAYDQPGRVYLMSGPVAPGALDPADARVIFAGTGIYGMFGWSIDSGDLDGDGLVDLVFGAPYADAGNGAVYVVPGSTL